MLPEMACFYGTKLGNMGVEPTIGRFHPQNGWVIFMENPMKMDDLGGKPTIFGYIHIANQSIKYPLVI